MPNLVNADQDNALALQLKGYRLATVEIIYRMPDHPDLLQSFTWQHYDLAPDYPTLQRFLNYWRENIEGQIHSVRMANKDLIGPADIRNPRCVLQIH